jgi:hypothetical protein
LGYRFEYVVVAVLELEEKSEALGLEEESGALEFEKEEESGPAGPSAFEVIYFYLKKVLISGRVWLAYLMCVFEGIKIMFYCLQIHNLLMQVCDETSNIAEVELKVCLLLCIFSLSTNMLLIIFCLHLLVLACRKF